MLIEIKLIEVTLCILIDIFAFYLRISGEFYVNEKKNNYFDLSILEQFNINIESHGIRNIIIHPKIEPLSHDCYFILKLRYNNTIEKEVKVYCNYIYSGSSPNCVGFVM